MKVCFWYANKPRERLIGDAFLHGCRAHGEQTEMREITAESKVEVADCDVAIIFGVKGREMFIRHWAAGIHTVLVDKGYVRQRVSGPVRSCEYWRVAVDGHHPTRYIGTLGCMPDRWLKLGLRYQPWRASGGHIVYAGSSAKYHAIADLIDPNEYAENLIKTLRQKTKRDIIYRPKPSYKEARPVDGSKFSEHPERIADVLKGAHVMITNGSNACFESVLAGIPCIVLGDAVAKPISSTTLDDLENPILAPDEARLEWFSDLAYSQYTAEEFESGFAWQHIRARVLAS